MSDDHPTIDEPATAEYVLAVLRDEHRQQCHYDDLADPDVTLSFETTVNDWSDACDLVGWRELGRALNHTWGIACSDAEWRAVLQPYHRRRLSDVCELIARHATRRRIRPVRLLGSDCRSAGAFLTIRSMLRRGGANVNDLSPLTPLAEFTRRDPGLFFGPISRLAPGCLPPVDIRCTPVCRAGCWGAIVGPVCILTGGTGGFYPLTLLGVPLFGLCFLLSVRASESMPPVRVAFGELRTFRDLAVTIARGEVA